MMPRSSATPLRLAIAAFAGLALAALALALAPASIYALRPPAGLAAVDDSEDVEALETIAAADAEQRESALRASRNVDALVELQRMQEHSSAQFQARIAPLDRELQEQVYELVREPGLVAELAAGGPKSPAELDAIASRRPDALGPAIRALGSRHGELLADIAQIEAEAEDRFEVLLEDLPEADREAFRDLVEHPELLSVLARRVRLTLQLGESFRDDPDGTRGYLAELGVQVAARGEAAEREWVEGVASDPEATAELEQSARVYADEYGYDYVEITRPAVRRTVTTVIVHPYPYWFGCPPWFADVWLYPYGYWYPYPAHLGFYYHGGHAVHFGFPSPHFVHWFFWRHRHHHDHHRHLVHRFEHVHRHHPHARGHAPRAVARWKRWQDHPRFREVAFERRGGDGRGDWRVRRGDADRSGRGILSHRGFHGDRSDFRRDRDRDGRRQLRDGDVRSRDVRPRDDPARPRDGQVRPRDGDARSGDGRARPRDRDVRADRRGRLERDVRARAQEVRARDQDVRPRDQDVRPRDRDARPPDRDAPPRTDARPPDREVRADRDARPRNPAGPPDRDARPPAAGPPDREIRAPRDDESDRGVRARGEPRQERAERSDRGSREVRVPPGQGVRIERGARPDRGNERGVRSDRDPPPRQRIGASRVPSRGDDRGVSRGGASRAQRPSVGAGARGFDRGRGGGPQRGAGGGGGHRGGRR